MQKDTAKTEKNRAAQAEDLALKSAAAFFGEELIGWLGIRKKVLRAVPTELVELEARHMYEDFLYEMEDRVLYHFEFESDSISEEDFKRFREYEASTSRIYGMPVVTCVICSSRVGILRDSFTEGINTYRVKLIRLKDQDADRMLKRLTEMPDEELERADMIPLIFSPLMGGESKLPERILKSIRILKRAEGRFPTEDMRKMESILYILAVKFLNEDNLKMIKEEIAMTKLGQMIWDDAMERGIEQGIVQGRREGERIGQERYSHLILILSREQRMDPDQIVKIASDPEYREALYQQYGI